jgi:hypothetical protein
LRVNRKIIRTLGIVFFSFLVTYFSTNTAHAAPTTITGTISNIPTDAYVQVKGEIKVGDTWVDIPGAWTDKLQETGGYSLNLGEATGSQIRVWVLADTGSSYLTGGNPVTVNSTSITKNFTFGSINVKLQASNPDHCINGSAGATFSDLSEGALLSDSIYASMNLSGIASFSLPTGNEIVFRVYCGSKDLTEVTVTTTSSLQTITVTAPTPNLVGTISGITNGYDVWGCVEKLVSTAGPNRFQCQIGISLNNSGKFAARLNQGTYRIVLNPSESANSDWVNTYSEEFTIATTQVTLNFTMSTTANFIYTITPSSAAKDGWVNLSLVCAFSKGNEDCSETNLSRNIPASGVVKFNVEPGTYILSASQAVIQEIM